MSPVTRRIKKGTQMSITSLIDILTILLLFVMYNVSSDPEIVPTGVELEEAIFKEEIADNSKIISLNVSYTGRDSGMVTYQRQDSDEYFTIANLSDLRNSDTNLLAGMSTNLDEAMYDILGDNLGDTPVVIKIKAHRNTAFKYINTLKTLLMSIWNDENSLVRTRVGSKEFKLYFATEFADADTKDYYRILSAYGLGGI